MGCDQQSGGVGKPGLHVGIALLAAESRGDIFLALALWEDLGGAGLAGSRGACSLPGSQCCCLHSKEIPQEIPQQPTNWSHWALEAQALSKR